MKNQKIYKLLLSALVPVMAGVLFMGAPSAHAISLTSAGGTFQIGWLLQAGQNDNDGGAPTQDLSALGTFEVTTFNAATLTMNVTIDNTTQLTTYANAGITAFGIGTDPNATNVTLTNSDGTVIFTDAQISSGQQQFPGGFKQIDVCVYTQGCSGGSQGSALAAGASDTFTLTIMGNFSDGMGGQLVTLQPFPIKFQTTGGSFEFGGTPVPEPTSLLLSGLGLAAVAGYALRRQRKINV